LAQQNLANRWGYVIVAVDWAGMCSDDLPAIVAMVATDLGRFSIVPDRSAQGFINQLHAMKLLMGAFANDTATVINGRPTIDPTRRFFYGNSMGGIYGLNYMAISTDVERGCLGVAGGPYGILLARSRPFQPFYWIIKLRYKSTLARAFLISFLDQLWDR